MTVGEVLPVGRFTVSSWFVGRHGVGQCLVDIGLYGDRAPEVVVPHIAEPLPAADPGEVGERLTLAVAAAVALHLDGGQQVERVVRLVDLNEYKRRQAPPGVKIGLRNFGRDRRYPITNGFRDA